MSDLVNRNAEAAKQGFEDHETRIVQLENDNAALRGQMQTLINMVTQLQQTNNLALAKLAGTGATS